MAELKSELAEATFACGCFWDTQDAFDKTSGVVETKAGYMGGKEPHPDQKLVSKGGTGYVEAVQVKYDPSAVSYERLLQVFWKQAPKITLFALESHSGQYAPIIFTNSEEQFSAACESLMQLKKEGKRPVMTTYANVQHASQFWAEPDEVHQHFYRRHPKPQWMG
jgi:methionine-S-sulfoxide reductase